MFDAKEVLAASFKIWIVSNHMLFVPYNNLIYKCNLSLDKMLSDMFNTYS